MRTPDCYLLFHRYIIENDRPEVKILGLFSDREKAEDAAKRFLILPGFSSHPDGFEIVEVYLDIPFDPPLYLGE